MVKLVMKDDRDQYAAGDEVIGQHDEQKTHHAFHEECAREGVIPPAAPSERLENDQSPLS